MKFSKKILPLFLALSFFVPCNAHFLSKHSRPIMIGLYSSLGLYSSAKTLQGAFRTLRMLVCIKKESLETFDNSPNVKKAFAVLAILIGAPIIAFFGSLTYFATKNLIEEIKNKDKNESEEKEKEKHKELEMLGSVEFSF